MPNSPAAFRYPSTRYSGSKRRLLAWIWDTVEDLRFSSVLDVFGGTGSVSLLFKRHGKRVLYNDLLRFNQIVGTAIVENDDVTVSDDDLRGVLDLSGADYPDFIARHFQGLFFLDEENEWLDKVVYNIHCVRDRYKRAILLASLFQACLAKRPYNLFHRANLYFRTADVPRTFYNSTTWERPFPELLRRYVAEYNFAVFSNGRHNRVIGGYDALSAPNGVELVYLDPPYFAARASAGTNYLSYYHFLEGLAEYKTWSSKQTEFMGKAKRIPDTKEIFSFTRKREVVSSFSTLLERFQDCTIVLSYQDDGIPSRDEIEAKLLALGKRVRVLEKEHRYVLSPSDSKELLFIAT